MLGPCRHSPLGALAMPSCPAAHALRRSDFTTLSLTTSPSPAESAKTPSRPSRPIQKLSKRTPDGKFGDFGDIPRHGRPWIHGRRSPIGLDEPVANTKADH
ncbi:hypothetical protein BDW67DRAFT_158406 [Aspergillus spinulosporus]